MKRFKTTALTVMFFVLTLTVLTITLFREKGSISYQENRVLAGRPSFSVEAAANGDITRDFGSYITDHFAGRSYLLKLKGVIDINVGERMINGVYISSDRLLSANNLKNVSTEGFTEAVNTFSDNYEGTVYFTALPTSTGVYGEMLPEYLNTGAEKQRIDSLYGDLGDKVRRIDAYSILKMLNDNYIYYRNDTKWTSYGAYCVYRTVIQKLGFSPIAYDRFTIEHVTGEFRGNLYNRSQYTGIKADMLDIYEYRRGTEIVSCKSYDNSGAEHDAELYDKSFIGTHDMYRLYLGEKTLMLRINTGLNNDKKLLVIKDDYANCFVPFLTQHYSEICVISPDMLTADLSQLLDVNEYEQTLFLFGIENISDELNMQLLNR